MHAWVRAASLLALLALCSVRVEGLYSAGSAVVELTEANFQSKVKAAGLMIVEFYAPWCGHCKNFAPEYEKAARALKGIVSVGGVDADVHKGLGGTWGIKGFPTVKLIYLDDATGSLKASDYNGARTAAGMVDFALDKAKALAKKRLGGGGGGSSSGSKASGSGSKGGSNAGGFYPASSGVVNLGPDSFDEEVKGSQELWLVEFFAPWCGHCKALKPAWERAAQELSGKVKLGAVDCDSHESLCAEYGVQGFPTIKFFGDNKRRPEDYQGGRDAADIVAFASAQWSAKAPPPEVKELVSQAVLEADCTGGPEAQGRRQLCFLAFLPDILDSKAQGRNGYIDTLKGLAAAYKDRPFSWLWLQGGSQPGLEAAMDVSPFNLPALVAFNPKEKRFVKAKEVFKEGPLKEFVESIRRGASGVSPLLSELPPSLQTVAPWDGKDAAEVIEDEFSLEDLE